LKSFSKGWNGNRLLRVIGPGMTDNGLADTAENPYQPKHKKWDPVSGRAERRAIGFSFIQSGLFLSALRVALGPEPHGQQMTAILVVAGCAMSTACGPDGAKSIHPAEVSDSEPPPNCACRLCTA